MRSLIVSEWITLDGVFDAMTMDRWFNPFHSDQRAEYIQNDIMEADTLLLGRETYQMLAPYWSSMTGNEMGIADQLNSCPKFVASSTLDSATWQNTTIIRENVAEAVKALKQAPGENIRIAGSATLVESLLPTGLIDEFRLLVHPVLMGTGKRFFRPGMNTAALDLARSETFANGVVLLCYRPSR